MKKYEIPIYQVMLVKDNQCITDDITVDRAVIGAKVLKEFIGNTDRENFCVLLLNTKNNIIGINTVSIGTLDTSIVHPREIFKPAILSNAAQIILCHNHPSGDSSPSSNDIETTRRIRDAGIMIGIHVRDHLIVTDDDYFSFVENDIIFREVV